MANQSQGGFCEQHGPYEPPNTTCPYCEIEQQGQAQQNDPFGDAPTSLDHFDTPQPRVERSPYEPPTELQGQSPSPRNLGGETLPPNRIGQIDENTMPGFLSVSPRMYLIIKSPLKYRGRVLAVSSGQVIGRKDADILIYDNEMSRQHARLRIEEGDDENDLRFVIYDSGSENGTYVNGKKAPGRMEIEEDDEIRLGGHVFIFKVLTP